MRNLHILQKFSLEFASYLSGSDTVASACMDEFGHLLFLYTMEHDVHVFRLSPESPSAAPQHVSTKSVADLLDQDDTEDDLGPVRLVAIEYVQEMEGVVMAYSSGQICLYEVGTQQLKEVGGVPDAAIIAAKWSPNEEYYAVATDEGKIMLFTPEWDVLYEKEIDDDDLTFREGQEVTEDDKYVGQACISWRGDSTMFQINYSINGGFKCLTRDVEQGMEILKGPARADEKFVLSVAEKPIKELQRPISFMPSGSLAAGYARIQGKDGQVENQIIFWEKNGLRHGEFTLPDRDFSVVHMQFNADSSLLALLCLKDDRSEMSILVCARSNWAWQVKQRVDHINFEKTKGVRALQWLMNKKQQLMVVNGVGEVNFIDFHFDYTTSVKSFNHKAHKNLSYTCFVTDRTLNLTPLGRLLMPPPMSEKQIELDSFPKLIDMFGHTIATLCSNGDLYMTDCIEHEKAATKLSLNGFVNASEAIKLLIFKESHDDPVLFVVIVENQPKSKDCEDKIVILKITEEKKIEKVQEIFAPKVFALCSSASLRNSGFEKSEEFY